MRISRKKRPAKPLIPFYNINERIFAPQVRVIDADGANLGVFSTPEARRMAQEKEMDLVEINPKAAPPVAQIVNFSHFKYQREKELRKQKIKAHVSEIKGVRLSVRISEHDLEIRRAQAQNFLERGDKVKAEIILKGREGAHPEIAFGIIRKFFTLLSQARPVKYEQEAVKQGNKITAIIAVQ